MLKSVVVIDTPYECYDCPCYYEDNDKCEVAMRNAYANLCGRPSWCPLIPIDDIVDEVAMRVQAEIVKEIVGETE